MESLDINDFAELMKILSVPRPNGSKAERNTVKAIKDWLTRQKISYCSHLFRLSPFFFECIGVWIVISRTLLAIATWYRWGWWTTLIAAVGLIGGTLDVALRGLRLVTWLGNRRGENIVIEFPVAEAQQEIILSAHYDSKTELFDHKQRYFFTRRLRLGIILTIALGVLAPMVRISEVNGFSFANYLWAISILISLPMLFLAYGLGINLFIGRFLPPSQGAVDDGASCVSLLLLAKHLTRGDLLLSKTKVTIILFGGEEENMQGSYAYVRDRSWFLPVIIYNLELMAQNGEYVFWDRDGDAFHSILTSSKATQLYKSVVEKVTGKSPINAGPINSDGYSFLSQQKPTAVIGSFDNILKEWGLHKPTDNLGRVDMERLPEVVNILEELIRFYDLEDLSSTQIISR